MSAESPPLNLMSTKDAMIFHGFGLLPDGQTYLPIETDLSQPLERMFFHETMVSEEVEIETTEIVTKLPFKASSCPLATPFYGICLRQQSPAHEKIHVKRTLDRS